MKLLVLIFIFAGLGFSPLVAQEESSGLPSSNFSYRVVGDETAHRVHFSLMYLLVNRDLKFSDDVLHKADQLKNAFGTQVPVRNANGDIAAYMTEKREGYFRRFTEDPRTIAHELDLAAQGFVEAQGQAVALHLRDLALSLDPRNWDIAYRREVLKVEHDLSLHWAAQPNAGNPAEAGQGGVYQISFAGLGMTGDAQIAGLARNQALIKGLLVQELTGSQFAGLTSQMNATVIGKQGSGAMQVRFNQPVGTLMTEAIDEMMGYLGQRHASLPKGTFVELSFEEQYVAKDGPSAGVACTLLIESLLKGYDYEPVFAVTGTIGRNGNVGGVGGVDGKIRGAISRKCEIVAIPADNEMVIHDLLILEGPETLAKVQILAIDTFDQALAAALKHEQKDPEMKKAVETFREVQGVLNRPGGMNQLSHPALQQKLREVGRAAPNHLSAKYLILKAMGNEPAALTLAGSLQAIDRNAAPLITALSEGNFNVQDRLAKDSFAATVSALTRVRPKLDQRTRPCADAIMEFSGHLRTMINQPPRSQGALEDLVLQIRSSGRQVSAEYDKLHARDDVKKELMLD